MSARVRKSELVIEGYHAEITQGQTTLHADGRSYNQRDERAYQTSLTIPTDDLKRVAALLIVAAEAAAEMSR